MGMLYIRTELHGETGKQELCAFSEQQFKLRTWYIEVGFLFHRSYIILYISALM